MQPVLDPPVATNRAHQALRARLVGAEAGDEMARLQARLGAGLFDLAIDPEDQLDAREPGRLADVGDLVAFDHPKPSGVEFVPFFSTVFASGGRAAAARKLVRIASSNSG